MSRPQDPPWKVKTRPCPFYSRGRCLFSDSCNFVHTVKSPVAPELRLPNVGRSLSYPNDEHEHDPKRVSDEHPLFDLGIEANRPGIWDAGRRQSWASIHSIASADSNLSFPTDPSPTASRTSSPTNDDPSSRQVLFDAEDTTIMVDALRYKELRRTSLAHARTLSTQERSSTTTRPRLQQNVNSLALYSLSPNSEGVSPERLSDRDAQVVSVDPTNSLGTPFQLLPPKPRRTQTSREQTLEELVQAIQAEDSDDPPSDHDDSDASLLDVQDSEPPIPPSLRNIGQQLSLNEVFLNLQDPGLRPRRINRIMQGLSPETHINSVLPAAKSPRRRPPPFQGDGDWKSEAFKTHLAKLISTKSAQLSRSPPSNRRQDSSIQGMLDQIPDSAPARQSRFFQLPDALADEPISKRLQMREVVSPDGINPAFKRPQRASRNRNTPPNKPKSISSAGPFSAVRSAPSTPPPVRMGSMTLTPLHESPVDFRGSLRVGFTPLEDDDANAEYGVLGEYVDRASTKATTAALELSKALAEEVEKSNVPQSESPDELVVVLPPVKSPEPTLKPLRLSNLFDHSQGTRHSRTFSSPGIRDAKPRRPLSALIAETEESSDLDITPQALKKKGIRDRSPSPTPRKPRGPPSAPSYLITPLSSNVSNTQLSPGYPFINTAHSSPSKSSNPFPASQLERRDFFSPPKNRAPNSRNRRKALQVSVPPPSVGRSRAGSSASSSGSVSSFSSAASSSVSGKPLLFFAIGKDDVNEVDRLLASGEANANDRAGPLDVPALLFTIRNDGLKNKTEIVKVLLAYGADPSVLQMTPSPSPGAFSQISQDEVTKDDDARRESTATLKATPLLPKSPSRQTAGRRKTKGFNPEIDYYLSRIPDMPPRQLEALQSAGFQPLTRVPFRMVGQDLVLQELLRVLSRHSMQGSAPVSIIFAGPSGHGKSLLSRSIGELLQIPAHTINMTNLRTQDELLAARSLSANGGDTNLAKFLLKNEGKRCAVILEEIEKVADKSVVNTLLMPWELGQLNTSSRVYDTSKVLWIATSNAGEDLVLESELHGEDPPSERGEYLDLANRIRRKLIECLGASIVSRITAILPFLAFTQAEKRALAHHHLPSTRLAPKELEELLNTIIKDYNPNEGVRSIQRAVQRHYDVDPW